MAQPPLIWFIDDDDSTVDIVTRAFQKEHLECQLKAFVDVDALLADIQQTATPPTLLLTDYDMPRMNGVELIQWLKRNPATRQLKTVLFSRHVSRSLLDKAEALAVYQVANKPTAFSEWRALVNELCSASYFP